MPNLVSAFAGAVTQEVTVRSQLTPAVTVYPFAEQTEAREVQGGGAGDLLMRVVKPAVYLKTPAGVVPVEPWGKPGEYSPVAGIVLAVVLAGTGYLVYRGLKSLR